jgi:hypothetical protein
MKKYVRKETLMLIRRSFSLDSERDADLLVWLDNQSNASEAIRKALRAYSCASEITLEEVYRAVKTLEKRLSEGRHWQPIDPVSSDPPEDPDLAAQLDQLGL